MRIIGVSGKARSGKDEFARMLCEAFGFKQVAFASKVKEWGMTYFGLTHEQAYVKRTKPSRRILQGIGNSVRKHCLEDLDEDAIKRIGVEEFDLNPKTINRKTRANLLILGGLEHMFSENKELFRETCEESELFWVNYLFNKLSKEYVYVVSDVRYKNEGSIITANHGKIVRINRIDKPAIEAGENHPSEIDLDSFTGWDAVIENGHKGDWREQLLLDAINMVRKFDSQHFFTPEDRKRFKINID